MNFIHKFINIFTNFWLSIIPTTTNVTATYSSTVGVDKIFGDEPLSGSTTITSASALTTSDVNIADVQAYNTTISEAYVSSMNETELNEFIEKLEELNVKIEEKPKTLTKTINKNHYM